jgi:hypothetical protein
MGLWYSTTRELYIVAQEYWKKGGNSITEALPLLREIIRRRDTPQESLLQTELANVYYWLGYTYIELKYYIDDEQKDIWAKNDKLFGKHEHYDAQFIRPERRVVQGRQYLEMAIKLNHPNAKKVLDNAPSGKAIRNLAFEASMREYANMKPWVPFKVDPVLERLESIDRGISGLYRQRPYYY